MNFYINFLSAFKAIKNNPKRSILTMVGIIIGVSSVITILSLGRGFEKDTMKSITNSDNDAIELQLEFTPNDFSLYNTNTDFFQDIDLVNVSSISGVKKVSYTKTDENQIYKNLIINEKKKNKHIKLIFSNGGNVTNGRPLNPLDNEILNKVSVIDYNTAKELFGNSLAAIGQGIEIDNQFFKIVGVLSENENSASFLDSEVNIEIPKSTYNFYFNSEHDTSSLSITLYNGVETNIVTKEIIALLKEKGSLQSLGEYEIVDTLLLTKGIGDILRSITYFITAIAAISLFIAGVGVMNMMYISVSERTKEIGIRRALGATRKSILLQFLLEGIILTVSGGIIGYLIGIIFAYLIGKFIQITVSIDLHTIVLAIGMSITIGLTFSLIPASEASKKNLIDILR